MERGGEGGGCDQLTYVAPKRLDKQVGFYSRSQPRYLGRNTWTEIRDSLQIVLIGAVPANVIILYVGAIAGSGQRSKSEKKRRTNQTQSEKIIRVPHGILGTIYENKRVEPSSVALFEALAPCQRLRLARRNR